MYEGIGNNGTAKRSRDAVSIANGELVITGKNGVAGGLALLKSQTYGRYEVRARFEKGSGYGSALLLWPTSQQWPDHGELDISEITDPNRQSSGSHAHWGSGNTAIHHAEEDDFTQWHTFAIDWLPDRVTWYLDGRPTWTVTQPEAIPHNDHFLAIQFDTADGNYIPWPNASTPESVRMFVDYVRVYQRP